MTVTIGRRELLVAFGGAVVAWPLTARAQQAMPVIGLLCGGTPDSDAYRLTAFQRGLQEAGYIEGRNVTFDYRWAEQQYDRLPALAAELVRHEVALIVAMGGIPSAVAAKPSTTTIPILFAKVGMADKAGAVVGKGLCRVRSGRV